MVTRRCEAPGQCSHSRKAAVEIVRGRWDCEHQRGEELGLSGMDSVCEILINVVTANKPKMLTGLPKRGWS